MSMTIKSCAIVGSNGYIGKHLVKFLQDNSDMEIDCYDIAQKSDLPNCKIVDMTDRQSTSSINFNVDYLFMLAGLTGTHAGFEAYEKYVKVYDNSYS